jgi:hypothetical protein
MRDLNDLDPLPSLTPNGWYSDGINALPESKRQMEEWNKAVDRANGEDWQPYKRDGQIVPHTYINGQGKLKTEGYQPPEPPEADIPIPCVHETFDALFQAFMDGKIGERELLQAEPQTQTASQMEKNWYQEQITKQMDALKAELEHSLAKQDKEIVLTEADALADLNGTPRPDNPSFGGWIPHKPGDPMPCDPEASVEIQVGGRACFFYSARNIPWDDDSVTAWKPAT